MFGISSLGTKNSFLIEAKGEILKSDYTEVLEPFLDKVLDGEKKVRILFHTGKDFEKYSIGAAFEDFKLGIRHFNHFEKIAIVSDVNWLRNSCKFFSPLIPAPVKIFNDKDLDEAKIWLNSNHQNLICNLDEKSKILSIEISDSLSKEDFKILATKIDPWIENNGQLEGIILHVKEFPYWENIAGFISHISFVKNHHKKVKKVALVSDSKITKIAPKIASHFIKAEINNFDYSDLEKAKKWIIG